LSLLDFFGCIGENTNKSLPSVRKVSVIEGKGVAGNLY
jgi:hypothetical protein